MLNIERRQPFRPSRGLNREAASDYVGVSPATFDKLVADDLMPQPRQARKRNIWDAWELDAYFDDLPHATSSQGAASSSHSKPPKLA